MTNRTRRHTTGYCSLCFLTASVRSFVQVFLFSFSFVFFQEPRLTHQLLHKHLPLLPAVVPLHSWTGARRCHFPPEQTHTRLELNRISTPVLVQGRMGSDTALFLPIRLRRPGGRRCGSLTRPLTGWMDQPLTTTTIMMMMTGSY